MSKFRSALLLAALAAAISGSARADEEGQPLNAAGPVGASSGHSQALPLVVVGVSTLVAGGAIAAVLLNTGGHHGTSGTTGTTATTGTTGTTATH